MSTNDTEEKFIYNPDLDEVSELMSNTWKKPHWDYTPDVLSSYINKPSGDPSLSLGLYCGDQLAGYEYFAPYRVKVHDGIYPAVFATWWTVSQQFRGQKVALKLHKELLSKARNMGFAGLFTVTHRKSFADWNNKAVYAHLKESFRFLTFFSQMAALPRMAYRRIQADDDADVFYYSTEYKQQCMELINSANHQLDVAEIISEVDVDYIFKDRPLTKTWIYRNDSKIMGVFNIIQKSFLGEQETVNAYVEKIAFDGMTDIQIKSFLKTILLDPYWKDISTICIPDLGHFDNKLFESLGFYKTPKQFNLYYIPFDDRLNITTADRFYLDVF
jgi:hypothetical protein